MGDEKIIYILFKYRCRKLQINSVVRCSMNRKMRNAYKILVSNSQRKRLLGRQTWGGGDNIKMGLTEIWCESLN
jgi:hypothetical protein